MLRSSFCKTPYSFPRQTASIETFQILSSQLSYRHNFVLSEVDDSHIAQPLINSRVNLKINTKALNIIIARKTVFRNAAINVHRETFFRAFLYFGRFPLYSGRLP